MPNNFKFFFWPNRAKFGMYWVFLLNFMARFVGVFDLAGGFG